MRKRATDTDHQPPTQGQLPNSGHQRLQSRDAEKIGVGAINIRRIRRIADSDMKVVPGNAPGMNSGYKRGLRGEVEVIAAICEPVAVRIDSGEGYPLPLEIELHPLLRN